MRDEELFQRAADELAAGIVNTALWIKAVTLADGDEEKARYRFIKLRVAQLRKMGGGASGNGTAGRPVVLEQQRSGAEPLRRQNVLSSRGALGWLLETAWAIAEMCAGVVPQQPPTRFTQPAAANSPMTSAMCSGVSS